MPFRRSSRKFGNVHISGFDSKREYRRAQDLELQQKLGLISDLKMQVRFEVIPKCGKQRATNYVADFTFIEDGKLVVADAKGFKTEVYRIKKKLMLHVHGIEIREL